VNFRVFNTRFRLSDQVEPIPVNRIRGALGALLHSNPDLYKQCFDPEWSGGPSGFRNAPRPFVLRCRETQVELITFDSVSRAELRDKLTKALSSAQAEVEAIEDLWLPVFGREENGSIKVQFVTPTALKSNGQLATEPAFRILINRLAERVRALGRLYQDWPEEFDFGDLLPSANYIQTDRYEWTARVSGKRRSARSGHKHELRGYAGWAEYSGAVGRFLPLLEIGSYTGVGRNTVWGNGEIRIMEASRSE